MIAIHPQYDAARSSIRSSLPKIAENFNNKTPDMFVNMETDHVLEKMKEIVDGVVENAGDIALINEGTVVSTTSKASAAYKPGSKAPVVRPEQAVVLTYITARCQHMTER